MVFDATMPREDNLIYLDYLIRRLAAFPNVWWSLANEYDLCGAKTRTTICCRAIIALRTGIFLDQVFDMDKS